MALSEMDEAKEALMVCVAQGPKIRMELNWTSSLDLSDSKAHVQCFILR